jgi:hypothetical protein
VDKGQLGLGDGFCDNGIIGFIWIFFWIRFYDKPEKQKKLSAAELAYISAGAEKKKRGFRNR